MTVELVCIDVDGTLVGSGGRVPPGVWDEAEGLRARGVRLAVCSGRPAFGLAREYAERLDPQGWHVFQNGASIVRVATGESRSRELPPHATELLVKRARDTGRILELYTDADYAVESTADRAQRHAGLLGVPFVPRSFDALVGRIVRAQWLVAHEEAAPILDEPHGGLHLSPSLSPVMPDTTFVNMTPPGTDKTSAVRALAEQLGIPLERVMMVGDGANDVGVLGIVGFPVAMGNAEADVFEVARFRVGHVDRGGLIEAFRLAAGLESASERPEPSGAVR